MKKTIWKFAMNVDDNCHITMPKDAEILSIQTQNGIPCLWALVNPEAEKEVRNFEMFGTGHNIACNIERKFIGTFQIDRLGLVFHLFERITEIKIAIN